MQLIVNGTATTTTTVNLYSILQEQGLEPERSGIAAAVNGEVIPRSQWPVYELKDGDVVEVITAMQGG
jgi:sulfur carrier protein